MNKKNLSYLIVFVISALSFATASETSASVFAPSIAQNGECGPNKNSLRVTGASAFDIKAAQVDSDKKATIVCKGEICDGASGSEIVSSCGIHESEFKDGIYYVSSDYLCECAF